MAIPLIAAGIGAASNIVAGEAAASAQKEAANQAYSAKKDNYIKMQEMLEAIGIPSVEAQELILERPEFAGELIAEKLGPSALAEIQEDPRLKSAQMDALNQLQEIAKVGLTPEDIAQRNEMLRQSSAQGESAQKQILQSMAQRGTLDSGASLIAQLQANASQNADALRQSEQLAADTAQRRRDAIMQAANLSGSMSNADLNRQQTAASAADRISQFNTQNSNTSQERNLNAKQAYANQIANLANTEQQYNKSLINQNYNQQLDRWKSLGNISTENANNSANNSLAQGATDANKASGTGAAIGNVATATGNYFTQSNANDDQKAHELEMARIRYGK